MYTLARSGLARGSGGRGGRGGGGRRKEQARRDGAQVEGRHLPAAARARRHSGIIFFWERGQWAQIA